jgi:orotidine-5'-phosphate decarboxylase
MNAQDKIREKIIVALDLPSIAQAEAMVDILGDSVSFYKIGMELTYAGGLPLVKSLVAQGKKVFLDLKLHDIPHTVEMATARVADLGAAFLTVHAYPHTMEAARKASKNSAMQILGVTVMTSMDDADLANAGYAFNVSDLVIKRANQAKNIGIDGLICSATDIVNIRNSIGNALKIVTPGIRPAGSDIGDQKRIMTPFEAIKAGADYLVIGRPITNAAAPRAATEAIIAEIR